MASEKSNKKEDINADVQEEYITTEKLQDIAANNQKYLEKIHAQRQYAEEVFNTMMETVNNNMWPIFDQLTAQNIYNLLFDDGHYLCEDFQEK